MKKSEVLAIDLGGTKVSVAVVSQKGKVLWDCKETTFLKSGWQGLKRQLLTLSEAALSKYPNITALGIASAGPLHAPTGKLLNPTNFGFSGKTIYLKDQLEKVLQMPVYIENDAAAAAIAEAWLAKEKDLACITLGTGVGVGLIKDGKLVRGSGDNHPELGHLLLEPKYPQKCECGIFGCAESILGGSHFFLEASKAIGRSVQGHELYDLAKAKNATAQKQFDIYGEYLGDLMYQLVTIAYPPRIFVTGSIARASRFFLPAAKVRLKQRLLRRLKAESILPSVQISRLGNQAGLLGAAYVALRNGREN